MSVSDLIASGLSDYASLGANTTWNTIQGTSFTNIIGVPLGSRVNNVMGNDVRIVCPWSGLLDRPFLGPTTEVGLKGLPLGLGGDTDMVFGKKNSFTYFSATANCEFGINKIEVNYQVPDGIDISTYFKGAAVFRAIYYLPVITALLGAMVLTVMTLCLKHIWRFSSSTDPSNQKTVIDQAMMLFPIIEARWLYLVQYLHSCGASLIPLKIPLFEQLSASSLIEAQVDVLEKEIKIGKQRAQDLWLNLEDTDTISGENLNFCALSEPSIIAIAEMAENKDEEVEKFTVTQAKLNGEIIKEQT